MAKQITEKTISKFIELLMGEAAKKYGGETTINEYRVAANCYLRYVLGQTTSISELSSVLDIPTSTTHRSVTNLISKGWLTDQPDPKDGRRRIIELTDKAISGGLWNKAINWLDEYAEDT